MELRQLTEADAEAYRAIRLRGLREDPDAFGSTYEETMGRPLAAFAERLREQAAGGDAFTLGAFADELIGTVTLFRESGARRAHKAMIVGMYVASEARGRGVGRALLREAIARARAMPGLTQVHLMVVTTNAPARRLYQSLGFETYGREPRALRAGDRFLDEELMVLHLDQEGSLAGG